MKAVAPRGQCRGEQRARVQVALRRLGGADAHGLGGQLNMESLCVGLRVGGHGLNAQLAAGPQHAEGDLAPVGDQDALEHGLYPNSPSPKDTSAPFSFRTAVISQSQGAVTSLIIFMASSRHSG